MNFTTNYRKFYTNVMLMNFIQIRFLILYHLCNFAFLIFLFISDSIQILVNEYVMFLFWERKVPVICCLIWYCLNIWIWLLVLIICLIWYCEFGCCCLIWYCLNMVFVSNWFCFVLFSCWFGRIPPYTCLCRFSGDIYIYIYICVCVSVCVCAIEFSDYYFVSCYWML